MSKYIDLRSDTVTQPTPEMRKAMAEAVVGDDILYEDPTVNELQEKTAKIMGKEDALFVPSGVFANQLAFFTHCKPGDEIIISNQAHPVQHETGATAIISGANLRIVDTKNQSFKWSDIKKYIRFEKDIHFPRTALIEVQNSLSNGDVWDLNDMQEIYKQAQKNNISVHLDGARIFNAATYFKVKAKEIAKYADSVMFCLSKSLAAPVGSMLAGSKNFIKKARYKRKIMGGGMRQVGVLAAPGIIALDKMSKRLHNDHINAKKLAKAFAQYPDVFYIDLNIVKTNMLFVKLKKNIDFAKILANFGILTYPPEFGEYRFVTHKDISDKDIDFVTSKLPEIINKIKSY